MDHIGAILGRSWVYFEAILRPCQGSNVNCKSYHITSHDDDNTDDHDDNNDDNNDDNDHHNGDNDEDNDEIRMIRMMILMSIVAAVSAPAITISAFLWKLLSNFF